MVNIQDLFNQIREAKKERKDLRDMYRDGLVQADEYEEIVEQIKVLRDKKKQIEERVKAGMGRSYEKIEDLTRVIESTKEMMNDVALSTLMKGETVEVHDEFDNSYEPLFSVKFLKNYAGKTTA